MRIRKRLYDKAKHSNNEIHWQTYKHIRMRSQVLFDMIEQSITKKVNNLHSDTLSSSDW